MDKSEEIIKVECQTITWSVWNIIDVAKLGVFYEAKNARYHYIKYLGGLGQNTNGILNNITLLICLSPGISPSCVSW